MMTHHPISRRRRQLLAGAAVMAMTGVSVPALGQAVPLPVNGTVRGTNSVVSFNYSAGGPGSFTVAAPDASNAIKLPNGNNNNIDNLTIKIGSNTAVIDWQSFSIGRDNNNTGTVTFLNDNSGNAFSVLNIVKGTNGNNPSLSTITGILQGDAAQTGAARGSIWLVNPAGVVFGPGGTVVNLQSLVVSTLPLDDASLDKFKAGTINSTDMRFVGTTGSITLQNGTNNTDAAKIDIGGPVLLVAPQVTIEGGAKPGNIKSASDVGFVMAQDATIQLNPNSIIKLRIDKGTPIGSDALLLQGTVQGQHVYAAVATAAQNAATLLNVSGAITATTAVETENGIELRAGTSGGSSVVDIQATGNFNRAGNIVVSDTAQLTAFGNIVGPPASTIGSIIAISGNNNVSVAGASIVTSPASSAPGGLQFAAGNNLTIGAISGVKGNVSATAGATLTTDALTIVAGTAPTNVGNISLSGGNVVLTSGLTATGSIGINATTGSIATAGGTLRSNSTDVSSGARGISLSAVTSIGTAGQEAALVTGAANRFGVTLTGGNGTTITLGNITASSLDVPVPTAPDKLGTISLGDVDITDAGGLAITTGGGLTTGTLVTKGDITLVADGALKTASIDNTAGAVKLTGASVTVNDANSLTIATASATNGAVSLTAATALKATGAITAKGTGSGIALGGTSITVADLGTTGTIGITTAGAISANAVRAGGTITVSGGPASVTADSIEANGNISITTPGVLTINTAGGLGTRAGTILGDLSGFAATGTNQGDVSVSALNYVVTPGITSTRDLSVTRTGAGGFDTTGLVFSAGRDLTFNGSNGVILDGATTYGFGRNFRVTGAVTSNGALAITAGNGSITFDNPATVNGTLTLKGQALSLNSVTGAVGSTTISLESTAGDLATGNIDSKGNLSLKAAGGTVKLSGDTTLKSLGSVSISGTTSVDAGLAISGTSVTMDNVATRGAGVGDVRIVATATTVDAGSIAGLGDVVIDAATGASLTGATAAKGVLVKAGGDITASGTLTARSGNLVLDSGGDILGGANLVSSDGAATPVLGRVLLRFGAAGSVTLGNITGLSLDNAAIIGAPPTQGPADYKQAATLGLNTAGPVTLGNVALNDAVVITASSGNVAVAGATSKTDAVTLRADAGTLSVGVDAASTGSVASGGNKAISLSSGGSNDVIVRAGLNAGTGSISITSGRDVALGRAGSTVAQAGGSIGVTADRSISGAGALTLTGATTLAAGTTAPVVGTRSIALANSTTVNAGSGALTITAGAAFDGLGLGTVTAGSLVTPATIAGAVDIASLTVSGGIALKNDDAMSVGTANSSGAAGVSLQAGTDLVLGQANASGSKAPLTLKGGSITVTKAPTVNGQGLSRAGTLDATGDIVAVTTGAINIAGAVTTTGDRVTLDAGTTLTVSGAVTADTRAVLLGNSVKIGDVTTHDDIVVVARTGDIAAGVLAVTKPYTTDNSAPVDGNGNAILDPTTLIPTAIGTLPGHNIVMLAAGDILSGGPVGDDKNVNGNIQASTVNLNNVKLANLNITAKLITATGTVDVVSINLNATSTDPSKQPAIDVKTLKADQDIILNSAADIKVAGDLQSDTGRILVNAVGSATITGNVSTGINAGVPTDYIVRASSITVGTAGQTITQTGSAGALLQSTGGITALGNFTLAASAGQAVLDAGTVISGAPSLSASGAALVRQAAGNALVLGNINALSLANTATPFTTLLLPADYTAETANTLVNKGDITLGLVTVGNPLSVRTTAGTLSVAAASSGTGSITLDSALDLILGTAGQARNFSATTAGQTLQLTAQRSILGRGTLGLSAPSLTLTAGAVAPQANVRSIDLGATSTITSAGALAVVGNGNFNGLTLGDANVGSLDARANVAGAPPGLNGPIDAGNLSSTNGFELRSLDGALNVDSAAVTGAAQTLVLRAGTNLGVGQASATLDLLLRADNGDITATGQLIAGQDLKALASGALTLNWRSDTIANQTQAGRDIVLDGGSTTVRQLRAGDDIVLVARTGDLRSNDLTQTGAGPDNGTPITGADGAAVTDPTGGPALDALAGRQIVKLANGNITTISVPFPGDSITDDICIGFCDYRGSGIVSPPNIGGPGSLRIGAGSIGLGTVNMGGSVTLSSSSGSITAVSLLAGGALTLNSALDITVSSRSRGASVSMSAARDIDLGSALGGATLSGEAFGDGQALTLTGGRSVTAGTGLSSQGALTVKGGTNAAAANAPAVDVDLASLVAKGALVVEGRHGVTLTTVNSDSTATIRTVVDSKIADGNVTVGAIKASAIDASANQGKLSTGALAAGGSIVLAATRAGNAGANSTQGNINVDSVTAATSLSANAGNDLTLGTLTMTGDATLTAARNLAVDAINLGNGMLTATATTGTLNLQTVNAGIIDVRALASTVTVAGDINSSGAVSVQANGNATLAKVTSTGAVTLRAGQVGDVPGAGSGDLQVGDIDSGSSAITLRANNGNVTSGTLQGGIILAEASGATGTATIAGVTRSTGLTVTTGQDLVVQSAINIAGGITLTAGRDFTLAGIANAASLQGTATGTATINGLTNVTGAANIGAGSIGTDAVNAASIGFTGAASVGTGQLSAGSIDVRATSGTVNVASVANSGTVLIQASGNTTVGGIGSTGAVTLRAGQVGDVPGNGSGNLQVGAIDSGSSAITLRANNGNVTSGILQGGAVVVQASGATGTANIAGVTRSSGLTVEAGQDIGVTTPISIAGGIVLNAGRDFTLAGIANAASLQGTAGGTATISDATSVNGAANISAGAIGTAAVTAASIGFTGASSVGTGQLSATDIDVRATAGTVNVASVANSGTVVVQASGNTTVGGIGSTGAVTLRAGQVGDVPGNGSGNLQVGDIDSGSSAITLRANNGNVTSGTLQGGIILAEASGATGTATIAGVTRSTGLTVTTGQDLVVQSAINIAGGITLTAGRDFTLAGIANAASLQGTATGTATINGLTNVTGAANIGAGSIGTDAVNAASIGFTGAASVGTGRLSAGSIDVRATSGTVNVASVANSGTVLIQASGNTTVGGIGSTGAVTLRAGQVGDVPGNGSGNLQVGAIDSGSSAITLRANNGNVTSGILQGGAILVQASGATGTANIAGITRASSLNVDVGQDLAMTSAIDIAGGVTLKAGRDLTLAGVTNAASLDAQAGRNLLSSAAIGVANTITLLAGTDLTTGAVDSRNSGAVTATATAGTLSMGLVSGGALDLRATAGNATIAGVSRGNNAGATTLSLIAGQTATISGPAIASGAASIGANAIGTASVTAASITMTGVTGVVTGQLSAGNIDVRATAGTVNVASVANSGTVLVQASGNTTVGGIGSTGAVTLRAGQIGTTAGNGSGNLQTGQINAGSAAITLLASNGSLTATAGLTGGAIKLDATRAANGTGSQGDISVAGAIGAASLAANAGNNLALNGNVVSAGAVTLTAARSITSKDVDSGSADTTMTAAAGNVTTGNLTGGALTIAARGNSADAGNISIAGVARNGGNGATSLLARAERSVTLTGDVRLSGAATFEALQPSGDGGGDVVIGTIADKTTFLSEASAGRVIGSTAQVNSNGRDIVIGGLDLFPKVTADVGISSYRAAAQNPTVTEKRGNITVLGEVKFASTAGTPRRLTLGGSGTAADNSTAPDYAGNLVLALTPGATTSGGRITADNSVIRLRGDRVAVGQDKGAALPFLTKLLEPGPLDSASVRTQFTENPVSTFYLAAPSYSPLKQTTLKADRMVLAVGQWGVIQNTDSAAQPGGGVLLSTIQLVNLGTANAQQGGPVVGFFGSLGGQEGIAAALRITVEQLGGISPNNVRINGCIALTTAGCIVTGLPLPLVQLNDPGRGLLIRSAPDLILPVELISGTTNEALWRDDEDTAPDTAAPQGEKRSGDVQP